MSGFTHASTKNARPHKVADSDRVVGDAIAAHAFQHTLLMIANPAMCPWRAVRLPGQAPDCPSEPAGRADFDPYPRASRYVAIKTPVRMVVGDGVREGTATRRTDHHRHDRFICWSEDARNVAAQRPSPWSPSLRVEVVEFRLAGPRLTSVVAITQIVRASGFKARPLGDRTSIGAVGVRKLGTGAPALRPASGRVLPRLLPAVVRSPCRK